MQGSATFTRPISCEWLIFSFSGSGACSTITSLVRRLCTNWLGIESGLEGSIPNISIFATAVSFFGFHSAIDQPEGMDMTGDVSENGETDVDQEVTTAAGNKRRCGRRKEDGDKNEANV